MTSFLLDTNACIALLNGRPAAVRQRLAAEHKDGRTVALSSVAVFELWWGVARSRLRERNAQALERLLSASLEVLAFDGEDARHAGDIRAHLAALGTPIGAYDLLIAAQAVRAELTLVTANVREFARVPGLVWEDWTVPAGP